MTGVNMAMAIRDAIGPIYQLDDGTLMYKRRNSRPNLRPIQLLKQFACRPTILKHQFYSNDKLVVATVEYYPNCEGLLKFSRDKIFYAQVLNQKESEDLDIHLQQKVNDRSEISGLVSDSVSAFEPAEKSSQELCEKTFKISSAPRFQIKEADRDITRSKLRHHRLTHGSLFKCLNICRSKVDCSQKKRNFKAGRLKKSYRPSKVRSNVGPVMTAIDKYTQISPIKQKLSLEHMVNEDKPIDDSTSIKKEACFIDTLSYSESPLATSDDPFLSQSIPSNKAVLENSYSLGHFSGKNGNSSFTITSDQSLSFDFQGLDHSFWENFEKLPRPLQAVEQPLKVEPFYQSVIRNHDLKQRDWHEVVDSGSRCTNKPERFPGSAVIVALNKPSARRPIVLNSSRSRVSNCSFDRRA